MNLLIDLGNTNIKWCFSKSEQQGNYNINHFGYSKQLAEDEFQALLTKQILNNTNYITNSEIVNIDQIFVCCVATNAIQTAFNFWLKSNFKQTVRYVEACESQYGVRNSYSIPSDLGNDRWLTMVYAWHYYQTDICIFDCGTAITVDVVLNNGQHQGGLIAPGYYSQQSSLKVDTTLNSNLEKDNAGNLALLQTETQNAISRGCLQMQLCFIKETTIQLKAQYGDTLTVIVIGGGAEKLIAELSTDCIYRKDFLFFSLDFYCTSELNQI